MGQTQVSKLARQFKRMFSEAGLNALGTAVGFCKRERDVTPAENFRDTFTFTGRALFFTAMVLTVGFLLLCVSEFITLVRFGLLIGTGMMVSFLASITLLPAVLAALKPRFIWGKLDT